MSFTLMSVLILILFFMIACKEVYNGVKKGFRRAALSLGSVLLSLFLTFIVTTWAAETLAELIVGLISGASLYVEFVSILPSLREVLIAVLTMAIGSVLFLFIFFLIRAIVWLVVSAKYKKQTLPNDDDPGYGADEYSFADAPSKRKGALCGLISAFLITSVLVAPLMGSLELADDVLNIVKQTSTEAYEAIGPGNVALARKFSEDTLGNFFYRPFGRAFYNSVTSTKLADERVYLLSEADTISAMSVDMLDIYMIFLYPEDATQAHADALRRLDGYLDSLVLCRQLSVDVVKQCAIAWRMGNDFLLLSPPELGGAMNGVMNDILMVCENTNIVNVGRNIHTMLEIYAIVVESGILRVDPTDYTQLMAVLEETSMIQRINKELSKNPDMAHIDAYSIIMKAFASYVGDGSFLDSAQVEQLVSDIADCISDVNLLDEPFEIRAGAFADDLQKLLEENGLNVSYAFCQSIAEQFLNELPRENVSREDIDRLLQQYRTGADAGADADIIG